MTHHTRNERNHLLFWAETQLFTQGQWWSSLYVQVLHVEQWDIENGLSSSHFSQNLISLSLSFSFKKFFKSSSVLCEWLRSSFTSGLKFLISSFENLFSNGANWGFLTCSFLVLKIMIWMRTSKWIQEIAYDTSHRFLINRLYFSSVSSYINSK